MSWWTEGRGGIERAVGVAAAILVLVGVIAVGSRSDGDADATSEPLTAGAQESRAADAAIARSGTASAPIDGSDLPAAAPATATSGSPVSDGSGDRGDSGDGVQAPTGPADEEVSRSIPVEPGAHGVTDAVMKIGLVDADLQTYNAAIGAVSGQQGSATGNVQKIHGAVIDYVNANGGIAGRKVEPVFAFQDVSQYLHASGRQQEQQKACAQWTEDDPVFAASGAGMTEDQIMECALRTRTPMVNVAFTAIPSEDRYREIADYWYSPHGFFAARRERALTHELLAQGFFADDAKVAIMIEDKVGIRDGVEKGMKPALAAAGLDPALEIVYPDIIESPWPNYVLQLQSAGVTHVLFSATTGWQWSTLFMMRAAENQQYRPRWGIGSDNGPFNLTTYSAPPEQMQNTHGMGWQPKIDTGELTPVSESGRICKELMLKAGQAENAGDGTCEVLFFLKQILDRATSLGPTSVARSIDPLGTGYLSTYTIDGATSFSSEKHDGPSTVRALGYDDRCGQSGAYCLKYVGPPHAVLD